MLCTRRTSWAHACCMSLPPLATGRSLCTLTSPSSEPPATLVLHIHLIVCDSAAQLINQQLVAAPMPWRIGISSASDKWSACLPR